MLRLPGHTTLGNIRFMVLTDRHTFLLPLQFTADLRDIARSSGGSAAHAPKIDQNTITSSGQTNPSQLLDSASRSVGTESGTGAAGLAGGAGNVEIGRDASTNNVV